MRKLVAGVAIAALVLGASALSFWAGKRNAASPAGGAKSAAPAKAPAKGPPTVGVEAVRVSPVKLPHALVAVGSLRSDETVIVRPEVAGRITQILFREGEKAAKGDVLFKLDDSVQRADGDRARANLTLSKSKYERAVDLMNKGFISTQAKDEAENNLKVAQAEVELTQARLNKMQIRAPFSGTLGLRHVSVGDFVKEGQDLVNLESIDPLKVDFRVPEIYLSQLRDRQTLQITLDAIPDKAYDGRVQAINPLLDAAGRSVVIRAQVPNRDGRLRPGMFARVRLFTSGSRESLVIPEESLMPLGDDKFVFKVVDGKAQRQKVEIGQRVEGKVEVLSGLSADDLVVTAGQIKIREGIAVNVTNAPAGAAPVGKAPAQAKGS